MARPPAPKLSVAARVRQVLLGITALASLMALFFVVLRWRADTPKEHLKFSSIIVEGQPGQDDE
jgi:hypothetical protein